MDALFDDSVMSRTPAKLRPGAYHLPGWLSLETQHWITERFREWGRGPVPPHSTMVAGHPMRVKTVCLGWHWSPNRYSRTADDVNGAVVPRVPSWLVDLGKRAVRETTGDPDKAAAYLPDAALVNYYDIHASMGMHQDREEAINAPVVSLSIGDGATFRLGNSENRNKPYQDVYLASGDLIVFEGPARFAYHGVTRIHPHSAPPGCGLGSGRINITLRQTGLR
ncbi:alpha-ketoglutarate-dependent dioxygenase AlkB [Glutamicibacter sp. MNS18]|uniref:alpha-ketoglutarate-dependent dioxygenase AlkB family protein n=1 Tax=Glutamicibacter sp. MNS18 TaxID=2989817 RepID=UPI0022354F29|nr:alpha-ketoglutarate-dependent dioxygenase AlkB [Glutamicibacter sp. MNS18]MCW4465759.1 alpha-ketoglutarate-dependent dioxygenase AlkB [Glutamicibacter sp. MNS18]